jgi:carbonic anhydrase/acetyltransferase-like protein (isoleucine patch superfamily)
MSPQTNLIAIDGSSPRIDPSAWVAPNATVIGAVTVGADSGVFYTSVVRADQAPITIGAGTNLQDGVVVHADPAFPATIGDGVSVGHRAVLHGCTIEDTCLIGMGAIVLNGAVVGTGSLIAAGAVVLEGTVIPPHSLVAGVPGKVRRQLTESEHQKVVFNATHYVGLTRAHRDALSG